MNNLKGAWNIFFAPFSFSRGTFVEMEDWL
jgi:hypothetical protein